MQCVWQSRPAPGGPDGGWQQSEEAGMVGAGGQRRVAAFERRCTGAGGAAGGCGRRP